MYCACCMVSNIALLPCMGHYLQLRMGTYVHKTESLYKINFQIIALLPCMGHYLQLRIGTYVHK